MSVLTCPVCKAAMREVDREGVAIDICTQCRGVWLDRGELEKLAAALARSGDFEGAAPPPRGEPPRAEAWQNRGPTERRDWDERPRKRDFDDDDDDEDRRRYGYGGTYGDKPYKKSKMARLLDFFD